MEHRCSLRWRAVIEYTTLLVSDPVSWNCKSPMANSPLEGTVQC